MMIMNMRLSCTLIASILCWVSSSVDGFNMFHPKLDHHRHHHHGSVVLWSKTRPRLLSSSFHETCRGRQQSPSSQSRRPLVLWRIPMVSSSTSGGGSGISHHTTPSKDSADEMTAAMTTNINSNDHNQAAWTERLQSKEIQRVRQELVQQFLTHHRKGHPVSVQMAEDQVDLFLQDKAKSQNFVNMRTYYYASNIAEDIWGDASVVLPGVIFFLMGLWALLSSIQPLPTPP